MIWLRHHWVILKLWIIMQFCKSFFCDGALNGLNFQKMWLKVVPIIFAYANVSAKSKPYSKIEARKNRGNTSLNNLYIGSKLLFQTHFLKKYKQLIITKMYIFKQIINKIFKTCNYPKKAISHNSPQWWERTRLGMRRRWREPGEEWGNVVWYHRSRCYTQMLVIKKYLDKTIY